MECRRCASPLAKPGDFCLVCREANADAVVLEVSRDRTTLTMLDGETVVGETTVRTRPETGEEERREVRNYAGRVADELHRKRPESVYVTGPRSMVQAISRACPFELVRIEDENPVEATIEGRGTDALDVVDTDPADKIGGSHSTVIGGRTGQKAIREVAAHPHVKKIIPGPIDAGGSGSQSGLRAKATRADAGGNVRLLLRDGSSVQENRIVTTARDVESGERVRADLNEALDAAGFQ